MPETEPYSVADFSKLQRTVQCLLHQQDGAPDRGVTDAGEIGVKMSLRIIGRSHIGDDHVTEALLSPLWTTMSRNEMKGQIRSAS